MWHAETRSARRWGPDGRWRNQLMGFEMMIAHPDTAPPAVRPVRRHPRIRELVATFGDAPTVYLMARLIDFRAPCYDDALGWIRAQLPQANIQSPRELFRSNGEWLARWPTLLAEIHVGIVVSAGYIGPGVAKELRELAARDLPLLWLRAEPDRLKLVSRFRAQHRSNEAWYYGYLTEHSQIPRYHPELAL